MTTLTRSEIEDMLDRFACAAADYAKDHIDHRWLLRKELADARERVKQALMLLVSPT